MRTVMLQPLSPTALVSIRSSLQQDRALGGKEAAERIQHGGTMSHSKTRHGFRVRHEVAKGLPTVGRDR